MLLVNKMDKIVIFDWGGVIENHKDPEYGWHALTANIIKRLSNGRNDTIKTWSRLVLDNQEIPVCAINDTDLLNKWIDYIALKNGFDNNKDEFLKVYKEEYSKILYYKDVVDYLHSLRGRVKVGILSNLVMLDKERLDSQVDFNYIDCLFLSFELGMVKPNESIYKKVEELLNMSADKILFIDDRSENVEAAKKCGWNVLQAIGEDLDLIKETVERFLEK